MNSSYYADESDDPMDEDESNTRIAPPNSPTHQGSPIHSVTQQGQTASSVFQQCSHRAPAPHPATSNHPHNQTYQLPILPPHNQPHNQNYGLPTVPPHSFSASSVLSGHGNTQPNTITTTHQGQAQGNENSQPQDSSGQTSDMILHPVQSGPARQKTQAQQDALVGNMDNMTLDPRTQRPN